MNWWRGQRRAAWVVAAVSAVAMVVAGCSGSADAADATAGSVRVVAAENFWGDICAQIGGRHVTVTSIITDPNTDPHTYETSPAAAAEISTAQLVIENGFGYDDFVGKILATGGASGRRVLSVQQVLGLHGTDVNPHVWYDVAVLPRVAAAFARELSVIDPAHRTAYRAGARRFDRSLRPLRAVIATIKRKYAGAPISYTERVPGYLVQAAGLRLATPLSFSLALEQGNDPSPQDIAAFDEAITAHKVKVLLYNSQVIDPQTERIDEIAKQAGVPVVGVSETLPAGQSFQTWQLQQAHQLLRALGG